MTDKPDDQAEMVLSIEAFGRMVSLMAGQVSGAGSGPAQAANIEAAAAPQTAALAQWIEALYGDNADAFAKELGWLDAVSLRAFVEGGEAAGRDFALGDLSAGTKVKRPEGRTSERRKPFFRSCGLTRPLSPGPATQFACMKS